MWRWRRLEWVGLHMIVTDNVGGAEQRALHQRGRPYAGPEILGGGMVEERLFCQLRKSFARWRGWLHTSRRRWWWIRPQLLLFTRRRRKRRQNRRRCGSTVPHGRGTPAQIDATVVAADCAQRTGAAVSVAGIGALIRRRIVALVRRTARNVGTLAGPLIGKRGAVDALSILVAGNGRQAFHLEL